METTDAKTTFIKIDVQYHYTGKQIPAHFDFKVDRPSELNDFIAAVNKKANEEMAIINKNPKIKGEITAVHICVYSKYV